MHIAGIVENNNTQDILDTIKYLLNIDNRKVSFSEYGYRFKNRETWNDYCSAINQTGTEILIIKIRMTDLEEALGFLPLDTLIVNDYNEWKIVTDIIRGNKRRSFKNLTVILNNDIIKNPISSESELKP